MTTAKATPRAKARAGGLPPVTVARFEAAMRLLEQLSAEHQDMFVGRIHEYRETHRAGTDRPLTAQEAAQVAAGLAEALAEDGDAVALAERVQRSDLRAYDEPSTREVLLAAGLSTAPAFIHAALRLVALVELPVDTFEAAYDADELDAALEDPVAELRRLDLPEARTRAVAALDHLGEKAGVGSGEALRLLARGIWQALEQAALDITRNTPSPDSSLTGSLEPMDGAGESAFMDSE